MRRPFTLMEVVISALILAMVVAAVSLGVNGIYAAWSRTAKASYRLDRCIVIDRIVDSAFRNAVPFSWKDDDNKDRFIFVGDSGELLVSYVHRINNPEDGGLNFLRLRLENGVLVAHYRKTPVLWWENDSKGFTREEICGGVRSLSFLYADKDGEEIVWSDDWNEEDSLNIPLAIQMRLEFEDGFSELWLRRLAGAGLRETWGLRRNR